MRITWLSGCRRCEPKQIAGADLLPRDFVHILRASAGGIAQLVERLVRNEKARGSNPLTSKAAGVEVNLFIGDHYSMH
jgi:hypothetical protein